MYAPLPDDDYPSLTRAAKDAIDRLRENIVRAEAQQAEIVARENQRAQEVQAALDARWRRIKAARALLEQNERKFAELTSSSDAHEPEP